MPEQDFPVTGELLKLGRAVDRWNQERPCVLSEDGTPLMFVDSEEMKNEVR